MLPCSTSSSTVASIRAARRRSPSPRGLRFLDPMPRPCCTIVTNDLTRVHLQVYMYERHISPVPLEEHSCCSGSPDLALAHPRRLAAALLLVFAARRVHRRRGRARHSMPATTSRTPARSPRRARQASNARPVPSRRRACSRSSSGGPAAPRRPRASRRLRADPDVARVSGPLPPATDAPRCRGDASRLERRTRGRRSHQKRVRGRPRRDAGRRAPWPGARSISRPQATSASPRRSRSRCSRSSRS